MKSPAPLIDIGLNLDSRQFADDVPSVLQRAWDAGVTGCVLTGTSVAESEHVIELCLSHADNASDTYPGKLVCTAGIHPHYADQYGSDTPSILRELAEQKAVRAIGETGLDFNRDFTPRPQQEKAFIAQLELAIECGLPVFMHERDAAERQHDILRDYRDHLVDGVIHCFTGSKAALFRYLDMDLHIGVTGWICDERRGQTLQQLVRSIPAERLMIESDAPYLLPRNIEPKPRQKRNEPAYLPWVLAMVAHCRGEALIDVANTSRTTTERFFRLTEN